MTDARRIIIIGCGAGGGTSAQFARKTDRTATITIFEKGRYPQYSKCGLPYAIAGTVPAFQDLIEFSEEWFQKEHIDIHLGTSVESIDMKNKRVVAQNSSERIEREFDSLILATGATPWIPPIQQIQNNGQLLQGIFVLRTIDDGKQILAQIKKGKHAVIIGAGLIGLEMADTLHTKGMNVTVVEALPTILANTLDEDMSEPVLQSLQLKISVLTNHLAMRVEEHHGAIISLTIKENNTGREKKIQTDLLIIATGTKPETDLAKTIGCAIGKTGGIIVNEKTETSVKDVYAVGDCTEYKDFITNEPLCVGLGSIVVRQGISAGTNAAGGTYTLPPGVILTRTSEFFRMEIAAVGPVKQGMKNLPLVTGKYTGFSKPEYFPGKDSITIKVGAEEQTRRIISAQAVGSNAAQRINTLACAVLGKMTIEEFRKLETAYAPPIAPTLDALTLACDVAALRLDRKRRNP
ncbi:MAG TPA: FAD-dependent oxidoreductase [Thermoplasmata archaeon]|nr:FAD-dependent oxidoreductase [Thermoplasmata archaeon]HIH28746.1 FAD-dependent oxidoreductase [Thermoplasmata archaeon]